jgi:hypothetical protein
MLFLLFAYAFADVDASITNCGTASKFTIQSLTQTPPDTISAGENLTLGLLYTSYEPVLSGSVTTSVTYNFIPLSPSVAPLCQSVVCPLNPGQHDGSVSNVFPSGISGTVVTKIVWTDDNGSELLCIRSTIKC